MEINAQTKLTDILDKYPWLPDELAKLDGRFKIIKTPVGKMMIKNATIADAVKKTGLQEDVLIAELNKLIAAQSLQGDSLAASFASSCEKYPRKSLSTFYLRLV